MKLILITAPSPTSEHCALLRRVPPGLIGRLHVRWPGLTLQQTAAILREMPTALLQKVVLHQHHELASDFAIHGLHSRHAMGEAEDTGESGPRFRTRACHTVEEAARACGHYDSLLLSPVFPSISKPGHTPTVHDWKLGDLRLHASEPSQRRTRFCALGGVCAETVAKCMRLGFDEVAVLGAVWNASNPLSSLEKIAGLLETKEDPR